jgi:hypothetical protein
MRKPVNDETFATDLTLISNSAKTLTFQIVVVLNYMRAPLICWRGYQKKASASSLMSKLRKWWSTKLHIPAQPEWKLIGAETTRVEASSKSQPTQ